MSEYRRESDVARSEFLRRTGALGLAGAAALGYPLLEAREVGAAPLAPPKDVIAAGGGATIKIGHVDSFSRVYAAAGSSQQSGLEAAVEEAERKNNRIKYEIIKGDDASVPAVGVNEAKRLISQEKVDLLTGGLSSAVGLAISATAQENGVFWLAIGTHDTNITGPKANRVCFRATCSEAMLANALCPPLLKHGKKWYFIIADYAFGTDGAERAKKILLAQGGQVMGWDLHPLGATEYSSYMTKARNTDADVMFFSNYGPDTQNATKAFIGLGLQKKMKVGGILCGNEVAVGMPTEDLVGSIWGYIWGPEAGGTRTQAIYNILKPRAKDWPTNWRQYLGFMAGEAIINRLNAAGSTDTEKLIKAFEGYKFDCGKKQPAYYRACDHECVQETYAGIIVPKNKRRSEQEYFNILATVGGDFAAEPCSNPDSTKAHEIITSEKVPAREGYTVVSLR
ncbi:MAG: ABC transporter substrate-binding protein [Candidatus Eremiobacteraeota bacterium]|nr:ABC transporter substrate-binding protein [Candidatus Eremiobacteraeota bacterium]MBV8355582.1 ABC transporter substrate-binding protein [Candidatus Eremiobacteraeota bacterium]